jgi:hypothetical protein
MISWWAREDSNLQPSGYEPLALTIELRARAGRAQRCRRGDARYYSASLGMWWAAPTTSVPTNYDGG